MARLPPNKALQLTVKGFVPSVLWYGLASNAALRFGSGGSPCRQLSANPLGSPARIVDPFEYSQRRELSEADYAAIHAISSRKWRPWRMVLVFAAGVACLFWSYTLLLGITLLGIGVLALGAPQLLPGSLATMFRGHTHLHEPLTFGVSDQGLSVSAAHLDLRCGWPNVSVWHERDGWLRISPHGMQDLYFRVSGLREASVYERVIELCRKHGREFNAKERAA